jgi:hypothetical protein
MALNHNKNHTHIEGLIKILISIKTILNNTRDIQIEDSSSFQIKKNLKNINEK